MQCCILAVLRRLQRLAVWGGVLACALEPSPHARVLHALLAAAVPPSRACHAPKNDVAAHIKEKALWGDIGAGQAARLRRLWTGGCSL